MLRSSVRVLNSVIAGRFNTPHLGSVRQNTAPPPAPHNVNSPTTSTVLQYTPQQPQHQPSPQQPHLPQQSQLYHESHPPQQQQQSQYQQDIPNILQDDTNSEQPTYPTLAPAPPFTPRTRFTAENILSELYFYATTYNKAGILASHNYLRANNIRIDTPVYNRMIAAFSQSKDHTGVAKMLAEMKQDGVLANPQTHVILLNHAYLRANHTDFANILKAIKTMLLPREQLALVFNIRLKYSLNRTNSKELLAGILEEMRQADVVPDEYTFQSIMRYHAGKKDFAQCLRVLEEIHAAKVPVNEHMFSAMYDACANDEQVLQLQDIMKKMGVQVSERAYNMRIQQAAKSGDLQRCRELMRAMAKAGVQPTIVSYNSFINALSKNQQMHECNDIVNEMLKSGINPNDITYSTLVNGWAVHGYFSQALALVSVMRTKQLPTKHAMTSIIYHIIRSGDVDQGLRLFQQLVAEGTAEVETYNSVLYSLLEVRAIPACEQTYALMRERGVLPEHATYQALVTLAVRTGSDVLALRNNMYKDNVEPNETMFNTLLRHSKGPVQHELSMITEMRSKGYKPEFSVLLKVLKAAAHVGEGEVCRKLLADIRAHGEPITSQMYHLLVVSHVNANNDKAVWEGVAEMRKLKLGPTDETYKILLDFLQRSKNWERCVELLEEMETNHVLPVGLWQ